MRLKSHYHSGITASGKTSSSRLLVDQMLRLSAHSKREIKLAEQIKALTPLLDSFGNAKTLINPNASRHGRYLELHFNERGRISSSKILTHSLEKSRLNRLTFEERTYHIFYQFLAGATPEERDRYNLEDPSDYALLASSGCYRLPAGPGSDDTVAMDDLRAAMKLLGFKQKHMSSIFGLLVAILLLGNLQFGEADARDVSAYVSNTPVLEHVARLLGVTAEELGETLTNKTSYVRKELYTVMLNAQQSAAQRDSLVRDLYAILFAFVVETANHKIAPASHDAPPSTQVVLYDYPGFQTKGPPGSASVYFGGPAPLISAGGQAGFDEFCINFTNEMLHSFVLRNTFEDTVGLNSQLTSDGVPLPAITTLDNAGCIELIRGAQLSERAHRKPNGMLGIMNKACASYKSGKSGDKKDEELLQELVSKYTVHASFVAGSTETPEHMMFGINHYSGPCTYDVHSFVERDSDILDSAFVTLLRNSTDSFVSKLMSGPSLAAERHSKDESIIVQSQVSSRPLRQPTPIVASDGSVPSAADEHARLDPTKVYPVTTQLNYVLSEIMYNLDRTRLWTISCIRPNDSGSSNSYDKRRVKSQIRALLLPDLIARRKADWVVDFEHSAFCDKYVPTMRGEDAERIRQCAQANGWKEGIDYVVGHRMIWLSYSAWKMAEDVLRADEKEQRKESREGPEDEDSVLPDDNTEYTHGEGSLAPPVTYYGAGGSEDNLLLTRTGTNGTNYRSPNGDMANSGLRMPPADAALGYGEQEEEGDGWGSEWDKKGERYSGSLGPDQSKESGLVVKEAPNAVEEVPTSRSRRMWLWTVRLTTWWIPEFMLTHVGRMKRPDIRLAWREKVTIFWLIFLFNCIVIFYILEFGRLLCPNFDKAWNLHEVSEHTGTNDFWVAVQGQVYDVSKFVNGDHSDIPGKVSNDQDDLSIVAGTDMTGYFPPPLVLACPGLVSDPNLVLTPKNFTPQAVNAMHVSGVQQSAQNTKLDSEDWYTSTFLPKMDEFHKGPVVYTRGAVRAQSDPSDPSTQR